MKRLNPRHYFNNIKTTYYPMLIACIVVILFIVIALKYCTSNEITLQEFISPLQLDLNSWWREVTFFTHDPKHPHVHVDPTAVKLSGCALYMEIVEFMVNYALSTYDAEFPDLVSYQAYMYILYHGWHHLYTFFTWVVLLALWSIFMKDMCKVLFAFSDPRNFYSESYRLTMAREFQNMRPLVRYVFEAGITTYSLYQGLKEPVIDIKLKRRWKSRTTPTNKIDSYMFDHYMHAAYALIINLTAFFFTVTSVFGALMCTNYLVTLDLGSYLFSNGFLHPQLSPDETLSMQELEWAYQPETRLSPDVRPLTSFNEWVNMSANFWRWVDTWHFAYPEWKDPSLKQFPQTLIYNEDADEWFVGIYYPLAEPIIRNGPMDSEAISDLMIEHADSRFLGVRCWWARFIERLDTIMCRIEDVFLLFSWDRFSDVADARNGRDFVTVAFGVLVLYTANLLLATAIIEDALDAQLQNAEEHCAYVANGKGRHYSTLGFESTVLAYLLMGITLSFYTVFALSYFFQSSIWAVIRWCIVDLRSQFPGCSWAWYFPLKYELGLPPYIILTDNSLLGVLLTTYVFSYTLYKIRSIIAHTNFGMPMITRVRISDASRFPYSTHADNTYRRGRYIPVTTMSYATLASLPLKLARKVMGTRHYVYRLPEVDEFIYGPEISNPFYLNLDADMAFVRFEDYKEVSTIDPLNISERDITWARNYLYGEPWYTHRDISTNIADACINSSGRPLWPTRSFYNIFWNPELVPHRLSIYNTQHSIHPHISGVTVCSGSSSTDSVLNIEGVSDWVTFITIESDVTPCKKFKDRDMYELSVTAETNIRLFVRAFHDLGILSCRFIRFLQPIVAYYLIMLFIGSIWPLDPIQYSVPMPYMSMADHLFYLLPDPDPVANWEWDWDENELELWEEPGEYGPSYTFPFQFQDWIRADHNLIIDLGAPLAILLFITAGCLYVTIDLWCNGMFSESTITGKYTRKLRAALVFGFFVFLDSETLLFSGFFGSFWTYAFQIASDVFGIAQPIGIEKLRWYKMPLLATCILVASGFTYNYAFHLFRVNERTDSLMLHIYTLWCALLFLTVQSSEYSEMTFNMSDSTYGSTFYLITGFHGFHVLIGSIFITYTLESIIVLAYVTINRLLSAGLSVLYWHFVDVIWVSVLIFAYLLNRLLFDSVIIQHIFEALWVNFSANPTLFVMHDLIDTAA